MLPVTFDRLKLPRRPGVYLFKNKTGRIIYVGKAINLFHRVSSYFAKNLDSPKTQALVSEIIGLETIIVESEIEALILEANLIKKYLPMFNIRLTDNKDYLYIKITSEIFPKILTARKQELSDAREYFGPFPSARVVKDTLKKLRRIFPWCSNPPKSDIRNQISEIRPRPCFYYHLGFCPGACARKIDQKTYKKIISNFSKFMEGKSDELTKELTGEMVELAKSQQFEEASKIKKILSGITYLTSTNNAASYLENPNFLEDQNTKSLDELQKVLNLPQIPERIECYDISNLADQMAVGSLVVLTHGDFDKKWYRKFKIKSVGGINDYAMMEEILQRRLRHLEWPLPDLLLVDGGKGQVSIAFQVLKKLNFDIPLFGLAKRQEIVIDTNLGQIALPKRSLALRLLQKIRDEAHRFALGYHRRLRENSYLAQLSVSG